MDKFNHTPGPWTVQEYNRPVRDLFISNANTHGKICDITERKEPHCLTAEIARANAKLIASAPDLLDALKRIKFESCDGEPMSEEDMKSVLDHIYDLADSAIQKATE
jgi:hypothetical protein